MIKIGKPKSLLRFKIQKKWNDLKEEVNRGFREYETDWCILDCLLCIALFIASLFWFLEDVSPPNQQPTVVVVNNWWILSAFLLGFYGIFQISYGLHKCWKGPRAFIGFPAYTVFMIASLRRFFSNSKREKTLPVTLDFYYGYVKEYYQEIREEISTAIKSTVSDIDSIKLVSFENKEKIMSVLQEQIERFKNYDDRISLRLREMSNEYVRASNKIQDQEAVQKVIRSLRRYEINKSLLTDIENKVVDIESIYERWRSTAIMSAEEAKFVEKGLPEMVEVYGL